MDFIELRVHVPIERETDFYRWFADWRDGVKTGPFIDPDSGIPDNSSEASGDLDRAVAWWKSLKFKERAVWGMWIDAAPAMVPASEIVESLGLKSPRDIPGILSWVGRKGKQAEFRVSWKFREDPMTTEPVYGIEDEAYAELLRQARRVVENRAEDAA